MKLLLANLSDMVDDTGGLAGALQLCERDEAARS